MKKTAEPKLDNRMRAALEELQGLITARYPEATFRLGRDPEDREVVVLEPTVDVDDRDEVMDVIIDRLVQMYALEDLPIMVVPHRTEARNEAIRKALREAAESAGSGPGGG